MATTPVVTQQTAAPIAQTAVHATGFLDKFKTGFVSVMKALATGAVKTLDFVLQTTPKADAIADLILPGYKALADGAASVVVGVASVLKGAILAAQQQGGTVMSSADKFAQVAAIARDASISILGFFGVVLDYHWFDRAVAAIVAFLHLQPFTPEVATA